MIKVTAINNNVFYLNEDNIEKMENVPETIITMSNDRKYMVVESIDEIMDEIVLFKRRFMKNL
ncbi:flagellar protein FlbD [Hathewaya proteolytica DSM 3090]|uniref:Flagellar protein FlbD n=1 Tax=Hathewaya proteolytica DSM 3090 TaxID=1121331 RepID=A0A1M6LA36_9CLOT|nr:flagellar FlbD family protein [Hathewaya proteolytica]SHJ68034.1 flagellar protein FlbD [Hathewaya proteolytica DSM 3090]